MNRHLPFLRLKVFIGNRGSELQSSANKGARSESQGKRADRKPAIGSPDLAAVMRGCNPKGFRAVKVGLLGPPARNAGKMFSRGMSRLT